VPIGRRGDHPVRRQLPRPTRVYAFDLAAAALFLGLVALVLATFRAYAVSNDEEVQHHYAELILRYYASGFTDNAVFQFRNLYLYGGLFDLIAVGLQHALPVEPYTIRHLLCASFGLGGVYFVWASARLMAGSAAGFLAAAMLVTCGSFYGTIFNHTKDVPFAAAMMGAVYVLLRMMRDIAAAGRPQTRDLLSFAVLLGCATGIRVTGLLLVIYAGLAVLLQMPAALARLRETGTGPALRFLARNAALFMPVFALAYAIMIFAWPWAALAPLNPLRAIAQFADFNYKIRTLLAGQEYYMATTPSWYVPLYFLVKLPIAMMACVISAVMLTGRSGWLQAVAPAAPEQLRRDIWFVAFAATFPLLCQVVGHGPAFTGLRHFTFLILPLAVLSGVGGVFLVQTLGSYRRPVGAVVAASLVAGIALDARTLVRLHPYEYLYFNAFVGGLPGAAGRYDTDYWANMMNEGVEDLERFLDRTEQKTILHSTYSVAICAEAKGFEVKAAGDRRLVLTKDWRHADFFIAPTHMSCDQALNGKVIATISRLGVPIGVVKDRRNITRPVLTYVAPMP
jgi:hypothetical protein